MSLRAQPRVAVLDYGSGNVHSGLKALSAAGARVELTRERHRVLSADGVFVPGVGAFAAVMQQLRAIGGGELIAERLLAQRKVLGVCVGLQIMFANGAERGVTTAGLGHFPGTVRQLSAPRLPHMGWNTLTAAADSQLLRGLEKQRFYFVHSCAAPAAEPWPTPPGVPAPQLSYANYGEKFIAACEMGPLSATQFHPEKSAAAGIQLLRNWVGTL